MNKNKRMVLCLLTALCVMVTGVNSYAAELQMASVRVGEETILRETHTVKFADGAAKNVKNSADQIKSAAEKAEQERKEAEAKKKAEAERKRKEAEARKKKAAAKRKASAKKQNTSVSQSSNNTDTRKLMAAIIQCEAGGESYKGQVAVGAVVMNRVRSNKFPNSIKGVIYQSGQFTPASSGKLSRVLNSGKISSSCYRAADAAMAGENPVGNALYFGTGRRGQKLGNHYFR